MSQACPLIFRQIDGTLARVSAIYVSLFVVLFLLTSQVVFLYFVSIDFLMRLYGLKQYSIIQQLSIFTKNIFSLKTDMTDAGAKRLAAGFGLFFMLLFIAEYYLGLNISLLLSAGVFFICSSLEILFGYCLGCKIYFIIKKIYPGFME
ncbi:DUF4395 domain-containing protein [bacterium]|nr:DUF4395 domain-containing protein [bacterium]MBU1884128.1 DUF4395 domain-containing protein [bacterium]